ncbi:hypothetical protein F5878DRAFT_447195 [Lentinula raphanica]|uniref:Uncharacterized protein n=1 Tax=Lentinula raphanica TaxID=153919 RepID=A0AA38NXX9_9AGAR|nr:hypothetical protein F5880DRAFT_382547 [Lentinula raphanica]KAJ3832683.1 hypothetical protein F5878DRAFT_447195 [Lentinula raphanica]
MKIRWLLYTLLCVVADTLDTFLSSVISSRTPRASDRANIIQPSDVDNLSDEEILELELEALKLHPDYSLLQLTPGTVAKYSEDRDEDISDASEANTLNLVFAETNIPVPRVRRAVLSANGSTSSFKITSKAQLSLTPGLSIRYRRRFASLSLYVAMPAN